MLADLPFLVCVLSILVFSPILIQTSAVLLTSTDEHLSDARNLLQIGHEAHSGVGVMSERKSFVLPTLLDAQQLQAEALDFGMRIELFDRGQVEYPHLLSFSRVQSRSGRGRTSCH